jgi:hypothetical protein
MKKYLINLSVFLFLIFLLLQIIFPKNISAQGVFNCLWDGLGCATNDLSCDEGFSSDPDLCPRDATGPDDCTAGNPRTCVEGPQPQLYRCDTGTGFCVESNASWGSLNYTSRQACQQNCEESEYNNNDNDDDSDSPKGQELCADGAGIDTAIGCIPVLTGNINDLLAWALTWAIGIAGGIAFLLILLSGFQIITSQGNPERMKAGSELLTAAITGLLLLLFSVFILNFIGVDILGLPL